MASTSTWSARPASTSARACATASRAQSATKRRDRRCTARSSAGDESSSSTCGRERRRARWFVSVMEGLVQRTVRCVITGGRRPRAASQKRTIRRKRRRHATAIITRPARLSHPKRLRCGPDGRVPHAGFSARHVPPSPLPGTPSNPARAPAGEHPEGDASFAGAAAGRTRSPASPRAVPRTHVGPGLSPRPTVLPEAPACAGLVRLEQRLHRDEQRRERQRHDGHEVDEDVHGRT